MQAAKALVSLHICADSPEPSLFVNAKISRAGSFIKIGSQTAWSNIEPDLMASLEVS